MKENCAPIRVVFDENAQKILVKTGALVLGEPMDLIEFIGSAAIEVGRRRAIPDPKWLSLLRSGF